MADRQGLQAIAPAPGNAGADTVERVPSPSAGALASDPTGYVIEVEDEAVGLVTRHPDGMTFHAVHMRTQSLDGEVFMDTAAAQAAAEAVFYGRD